MKQWRDVWTKKGRFWRKENQLEPFEKDGEERVKEKPRKKSEYFLEEIGGRKRGSASSGGGSCARGMVQVVVPEKRGEERAKGRKKLGGRAGALKKKNLGGRSKGRIVDARSVTKTQKGDKKSGPMKETKDGLQKERSQKH